MENADRGIAGLDCAQFGERAVGTPVVDKKDLEGSVHAIHRVDECPVERTDVVLLVEDGNHD